MLYIMYGDTFLIGVFVSFFYNFYVYLSEQPLYDTFLSDAIGFSLTPSIRIATWPGKEDAALSISWK